MQHRSDQQDERGRDRDRREGTRRFGDGAFERPQEERQQQRPAFDGERNRGDFGSYGSDRQRRDSLEQDPQRYGASEWRERFGGADWEQPIYGASHSRQHTPYGGPRDESGPYQGKGPKGYQRADERVLDEACHALERDPHVDATEIEVSCQQGEIILKGSVDSRDAKRRAERCVEDLPGVKDVRNELRIQHART